MRPELLAPAGSPEALRAAVECGADAVYLGWGGFNARQSAKNFTDREFAWALQYCHERGVRVFLTLNTLVTDRELPGALACARTASALGVDAVLVQDWGLLHLLRAALPDLPLHASTQMSLFTSGGAREAAADGCRRVVLARECAREDVAAICQSCPAEIEVFVHGALCMCYSGQCAMSALIGGRSGNRGRCAQPCRLPYRLISVEMPEPPADSAAFAASKRFVVGKTLPQGGFTPPEDVILEGSHAADAAWDGRSGNRGRCAQPCRLPYGLNAAAKNEFPLSLKDSCLAGELEDLESLGVACLKLEGRMKRPEYVAVVTGVYARLLRERRKPTPGELAALEAAFSRSGFTAGYWRGEPGPDMFGVRPENAREPRELFARARAAVEKGGLRTVPVTFRGSVRRGKPCVLTVRDGDGHAATVTGPVPEEARSRAVTEEELTARLRKTGGTAYRCEGAGLEVDDGLSLSAAAVNALRRDALAALTAMRTAPPKRRELEPPPLPEAGCAMPAPELTCSVFRAEQLTRALLDLGPARVYVPLEQFERLQQLPSCKTEWCAALPRVWRDRDEPALLALLERARALGVTGALAGNLGHLPLLRDRGLALYGDFGLNVTNGRALAYLREKGFSSATASFELRSSQLRDLPKALPTEALVYGRLPLMITENCLVKNAGSCRCDRENSLTDRTGESFPLLPAWGCRTEVQNGKTLYLGDREDWKRLGLAFARLRFTTETPEECVRVFRAYQTGAPAAGGFTRGLFDRGVE